MKNVNDGIQAAKVRALFPDGTVEIMPTHLAVRKAQAMGLDLVLIAPTASPPIAKALRYDLWERERNRGLE